MATIDFPRGASFSDNVTRLEEHLMRPCQRTPFKVIRLRKLVGDETLTVVCRPGSYVSAAFFELLAFQTQTVNCLIDAKLHQLVRDFFDPIWNEAGHPTIDFLREPGVEVRVAVRDEGLEQTIDTIWTDLTDTTRETTKDRFHKSVEDVIKLLDYGVYRVAEPDDASPTGWRVNEWLKKAIMLYFRLQPSAVFNTNGLTVDNGVFYDKVPLKCTGWTKWDFESAGFRTVPGSWIRHGAFIGKRAVIMPSYINIGGYVDDGTMVDTWATVGSCAQIGKDVHLSGGVGIGGVLEPPQTVPTIIEDGCFIGARSEVVEGVVVKKGAALSMGTFIGANTPIYNRMTKETVRGIVPENAVVIMGSHPSNGLNCPHIVKLRDAGTDAKTALNEYLRQ